MVRLVCVYKFDSLTALVTHKPRTLVKIYCHVLVFCIRCGPSTDKMLHYSFGVASMFKCVMVVRLPNIHSQTLVADFDSYLLLNHFSFTVCRPT